MTLNYAAMRLRNEATILRSRDPRDWNARGVVGRLA